LDVADIIEYNVGILNTNDLSNSFFNLSKTDPTVGFAFDANQVCGHRYPESINEILGKLDVVDEQRVAK
jgi:DNA polymerase iota